MILEFNQNIVGGTCGHSWWSQMGVVMVIGSNDVMSSTQQEAIM